MNAAPHAGIGATTHVLVANADLVAHAAVVATLARLQRQRRVTATVFDRARLSASHLEHPIYRAGIGTATPAAVAAMAGTTKAAALATRLRAHGIDAETRHGNVLRWSRGSFAADLAIIGLDDESARSAVQRRLRGEGTPALFVGVAEAASVHAFAGADGDPCYDCLGQSSVPVTHTPCVPATGAPGPMSTRARARDDAISALPDLLFERCTAALDGRDFASCVVVDAHGTARARIDRHPRCVGTHACRPRREAIVDLPADATLGDAFAAAAHAGADGGCFDGCTIRRRYLCPGCGRLQEGRDLVRAWPAIERCGCGSDAVRPLARLDRITAGDARHQALLDCTLADLGMPAGFDFDAVGGRTTVRVRVGPTADAPTCREERR